jgi:hypothetical protein
MRGPEEVTALLAAGTLERDAWPELEDEQFAAEVRERLAAAGMTLVATPDSFLARLAEPNGAAGAAGFTPHTRLHSVHKAMIAVLYLYLRYLPAQANDGELPANGDAPSVTPEDVFAPFSYTRHYLEKIVLGELKKQGYVRQIGGRLFAGQNLMAIDPVQMDLRADEMVRRFLLKRFIERRDARDASDAADGGGPVRLVGAVPPGHHPARRRRHQRGDRTERRRQDSVPRWHQAAARHRPAEGQGHRVHLRLRRSG